MSGSRRGPEPKLGVALGKRSFPLRLPDDLRDLVADRAKAHGMSMNEYLVRMAARFEGYDLTAPPPASSQEPLPFTMDETAPPSQTSAVAA
ncbi:Arc family DNA-binding protein [Nonomuraea sp. NPDC004702]